MEVAQMRQMIMIAMVFQEVDMADTVLISNIPVNTKRVQIEKDGDRMLADATDGS
jgi:hypothetical protein